MALHVSTGLRNKTMVTGSVSSILTGGFILLYSGPIPDTADEAVDGSVAVLCKISVNGDDATGLSFLGTASNGSLVKADELWKSKSSTTNAGVASFYRHIVDAQDITDEGKLASGLYSRVQGAIGNSEELVMANPDISAGAEQAINFYSITFPTV